MLFQPMSDYPLYPPISFTIGLRKIHLSVALRTPCTQSKKQNCFTYFRIADRISNILPDLHPGNLFPLPYFVNYFYCELPFPRIFYFIFWRKLIPILARNSNSQRSKIVLVTSGSPTGFRTFCPIYTQLILFPVLVLKKSGKTEKTW